MKTNNKISALALLLLITAKATFVMAQYTGGEADGYANETFSLTSCSTPSQFYAYMGGSGDGYSYEIVTYTSCGTPSQFFAFMGGDGDGYSHEIVTNTTCGTPSQFYAYTGGNGDGYVHEIITNTTCSTPDQFYSYFGGTDDGFSTEKVIYCPTQAPVTDFTGTPTTVCVNDTVQFNDISTNSPFIWNWTFQGGTPATSTLKDPKVVFAAAGTYTITLKSQNAIGYDSIAKVSYITVNPIPVVNIGPDTAICQGINLTLDAGNTGAAYNWSTGDVTQTISVSTSGIYSVIVTANGCSDSAFRNVTVNPLPVAIISGNDSICINGNTTLTASGGTNYLWSTGSSVAVISVNPVINTDYTVTVTDVNLCTDTATQTITVNSLPVVTISLSPDSVCINAASFTLTGGLPAGGAYSGTGVSAGDFDPSSAGAGIHNIVYSYSDVYGCTNSDTAGMTVISPVTTISTSGPVSFCQGDSVTLTSSAAINYLWSTTVNTQSITVFSSGNYSVTTTDVFGCTASASQNVTVNLLPVAGITGNNSICYGESTTLTASGGNSYLWSTTETTTSVNVNPVSNTIYFVTVTDINSCSDTVSHIVTVNSLPVVSLTLYPDTVCVTDGAYALTGGLPSGGIYSGAGVSSGIFDPNIAGTGVTYITYLYTDTNTCTNSVTDSVIVNLCADINENNISGNITIYPNPFSKYTTVYITGKIDGLSYIVSDITGRVIIHGEVKENTLQIDRQGFDNGIYFFKLKKNNSVRYESKIIIQ